MNSSLNNDFQTRDEEFDFTLFEHHDKLSESTKQTSAILKEAFQKLEKCQKQYFEICAKLELLRAGSENLSAIILDSK